MFALEDRGKSQHMPATPVSIICGGGGRQPPEQIPPDQTRSVGAMIAQT